MPATGPVTQQWSTRCGYVYACHVAADGTFPVGPPGWTAEKISTGLYEIVHHLGSTGYVAVPAIADAPSDYRGGVAIESRDADKCRIQTWDNTALADMAFALMIFTL